MARLARSLAILIAVWIGLCSPAAATAVGDADVRVRVIGSDFVLPGRYARLAQHGRGQDVTVTGAGLRSLSAEDDLQDVDLIILDTPRPSDVEAVMARVGDRLARGSVPWVRVGGGPPASGGLAPETARRIDAWYGEGGRVNFERLFAGVRLWRTGGDMDGAPGPVRFGDAGYYHPDAVATEPAAFEPWLKARPDRPRAAILMSRSTLSDEETATIDTLIAALDRRGVEGVGVWFDQTGSRTLVEAVRPLDPAVLVNTQHLINGPAIRAQLVEIDRPALQTFAYRDGDADAFRAADSGIAFRSAAALLAPPESWGMSDPMVLSAVRDGSLEPIPEQVEAVAAKIAGLVALGRTPNADKRIALMFWNHPGGPDNISASNLNVPRSLEAISADLGAAGYDVPRLDERAVIAAGQAMLGVFYDHARLDALRDRGLVVTLPLEDYQAWLATIPSGRRQAMTERWGPPANHWAVRRIAGQDVFVIPAWRNGGLTILPQPPRAGRIGEGYHDTALPPDPLYMAAYLWVRQGLDADALVHLGTHGTLEFLPGKDRGLSVGDDPFLALGDLPVIYPYIQDNIGEAIQAKRRGRAVTVSHQTPPFAPAGLQDELRDLHQVVHEYQQLDEGPVRDATARRLLDLAEASHLDADIGWTRATAEADFPAFFAALHDNLHAVAATVAPMGLHVFGRPATPEHRLTTVMQQLGPDFYVALGLDPAEVFAGDEAAVAGSAPHTMLVRHLRDGASVDEIGDPVLRDHVRRAVELNQRLADTGESEALLAALAGRFVRPGEGGDPVRNPEAVVGRNLYAFEPDKIPTEAAWAAGGVAFDSLAAAYAAEHDGRALGKFAVTLWSSETIRTLGVMEAQVLQALGLKPVWDRGGRLTALEIIPADTLGRPRVDVVVHATGVYRDQFDGFMRLLSEAIDRLAVLDEPGNVIAANSQRAALRLQGEGLAAAEAEALGRARIFSNAPGDYGSGLPDAVGDTEAWEDPAELADPFMDRLGHVYGGGRWGDSPAGADVFAAQLEGVEAAALSRSSNVHGLLSTDHPFEYLGGLSLAVKRVNGAAPSLYITDVRAGAPRAVAARDMLATEMRARYTNRKWIAAMQAEGYAGTLAVVDLADNLFGWQATDPSMVRADQWQAVHDVYVRDSRDMGMAAWFRDSNPAARRQLVDKLRDAIAKGFWDADEKTRRELASLAGDAPATTVAAGAGYGLSDIAATPTPAAAATAPQSPPVVRGNEMRVVPPELPRAPPPLTAWLGLLAIFLIVSAGGLSRLRPASSYRVKAP